VLEKEGVKRGYSNRKLGEKGKKYLTPWIMSMAK